MHHFYHSFTLPKLFTCPILSRLALSGMKGYDSLLKMDMCQDYTERCTSCRTAGASEIHIWKHSPFLLLMVPVASENILTVITKFFDIGQIGISLGVVTFNVEW